MLIYVCSLFFLPMILSEIAFPTEWRCLGTTIEDRACMYTNLYYTCGDGFVALSKRMQDTPLVIVRPRSNTTLKIKVVSTITGSPLVVGKDGLHVHFIPHAPFNISHALFDGLYPAFLSMLKFGVERENFTLVLYGMKRPQTSADPTSVLLAVYETCSGHEVMLMKEMKESCLLNSSRAWRFDRLLVGSGTVGNMIPTLEVAIEGSHSPIWGTRRFRDRFYEMYGISNSIPQPRPVYLIFIDNKRFSNSDRQVAKQEVNKLNQQGEAATFVDWSLVGEGKEMFSKHLEMVHQADVYISSPGTGLLYAPFLRDGCVCINLGTIFSWQGMVFHMHMEQELVGGGTPYLRTLYNIPPIALVDPPLNHYQVNLVATNLSVLIREACSLVVHGFIIPVPTGDNLSPVGQVLHRMCSMAEPLRDSTCPCLLAGRRGGVAGLLWPEWPVLELGCWGSPSIRTKQCTHDEHCPINHTRIHQIRQELGVRAAWRANTSDVYRVYAPPKASFL
jgi:hypothetical protein